MSNQASSSTWTPFLKKYWLHDNRTGKLKNTTSFLCSIPWQGLERTSVTTTWGMLQDKTNDNFKISITCTTLPYLYPIECNTKRRFLNFLIWACNSFVIFESNFKQKFTVKYKSHAFVFWSISFKLNVLSEFCCVSLYSYNSIIQTYCFMKKKPCFVLFYWSFFNWWTFSLFSFSRYQRYFYQ